MMRACGTSSDSRSSRFRLSSLVKKLIPVTLPPGDVAARPAEAADQAGPDRVWAQIPDFGYSDRPDARRCRI